MFVQWYMSSDIISGTELHVCCGVLCCTVVLCCALPQSSIERVSAFVSSIINFYVWLFTTLVGAAQKAFGTITGG